MADLENKVKASEKSQVLDVAPKTVDEDLQVPQWPKYNDPVTQKAEIENELYNVKKEQDLFHTQW